MSDAVGQVDVAVSCMERARRVDPLAPVGDLVALLASLGRDDDARAWLAKIDSRPGDVPEALAPLTEAERRVALAVSRGLTNKEAAAELFVSVKTIDSHLQRIYPKLFVRSRGELAVLVNSALVASGAALGQTTGNPPDARR